MPEYRMPEYLKFRCCLCPQVNTEKTSCFASHQPQLCRFVKRYRDERGWTYFARSGISGSTFKTFYQKPGKTGAHGWRCVNWRNSFDEAQADLNAEAEKRGWEEV